MGPRASRWPCWRRPRRSSRPGTASYWCRSHPIRPRDGEATMSEYAVCNEITPSGFFALRTPLLPFDELLAWSDGLEAPSTGDDPARLEAACAADRARLLHRLRAVFHRP